jgi:hypothetical protein
MRRLFTYSSKIEISLQENSGEIIDKFKGELKKWFSNSSGEDADIVSDNIFFAVTPRGYGYTFFGIDSGEIKIVVEQDKLIVSYRLSYLSPFVPFFALEIFLIWLSHLYPENFSVSGFSSIIRMFLIFVILGIFFAILTFPGFIQDAWRRANKKVNSEASRN